MNGFQVLKPGVLSLIQDNGRLRQQHLGLSNGGPVDAFAFHWANKLLNNNASATAIEVSVGGLELIARVRTSLCVCGANMGFSINGNKQPLWQTHNVNSGDHIKLAYSNSGLRCYLAVSNGFTVKPQFGSTATVVREHIGGIDGQALTRGSWLPCNGLVQAQTHGINPTLIPNYDEQLSLRLVPGYQYKEFSPTTLDALFNTEFRINERSDRMAYQLEGAQLTAPANGITSEGNCLGAVQIPPDGKPFILLNDRQTIGGYAKPGAILSLDCAKLSQRSPGTLLRFKETSLTEAKNLLIEHRKSLSGEDCTK